jgi:hypothetical protein
MAQLRVCCLTLAVPAGSGGRNQGRFCRNPLVAPRRVHDSLPDTTAAQPLRIAAEWKRAAIAKGFEELSTQGC